jgi:glycosyltransferase involved in cell wall biosynthesis
VRVSCIIPFFNERERITNVLATIGAVDLIDEIVCVDDGSTDGGLDRVALPERARVVRLPRNTGKAGAVREGARAARGEYALLVDADLRGANPAEIRRAVAGMLDDPALGMVILRRAQEAWNVRLINADAVLSGERILRRAHLLEVLAQDIRGYQLEVAINRYMLDRGLACYWVHSSALDYNKVVKWGVLGGIWREVQMNAQMVRFVGLAGYLRQLLTFCRDELPVARTRPAPVPQPI